MPNLWILGKGKVALPLPPRPSCLSPLPFGVGEGKATPLPLWGGEEGKGKVAFINSVILGKGGKGKVATPFGLLFFPQIFGLWG